MKRKKVDIKRIGLSACFIFLLMSCGEAILRQDLLSVFSWAYHHPISFSINYFVLFTLFIVLSSILNHLGRGFRILAIIYITLCVVSYYKFKISGEYLIPADFLLVGEAAKISSEMQIRIEHHIIQGVLFSIILILVTYLFKPVLFGRKQRFVLMSSFSLFFLITVVAGANVLNEIELEDHKQKDINKQYEENGFIMGFSQELDKMIINRPESYDAEKVTKLLESYKKESKENDFKKPHIIMVMSESYFDITTLDNVEFSKDPLDYFHELQRNYVSGNLIVPVYGGRTAQTEYEVLTGHSVDFTGIDNIAYMRFIDEQTPSIPKLLKSEGYETIAIHSYDKAFFSRDTAYIDLGFDHFIGDEDFKNPDYFRGYLSDRAVSKQVIETFEAQKHNKEPLFFHVVTMQNHMPYSKPNKAVEIEVQSDQLNKVSKGYVEDYIEGLKASDEALRELTTYFEKIDEPVVIVMFGDHLPALGEHYGVYLESGFVEDSKEIKDMYKLHQTPFVIWNNFGLPKEQIRSIDASYLGAYMLDYIGYNKDPYMNMLLEYSKNISVYSEDFIKDQYGHLKDMKSLTKKEEGLLQDLWHVQYQRLFEQ